MNRSEFNQGSEMRIGNNPYLIASYVKDLEFIVAEDGMSEILTWTRAANWKPNTDGVMECQGAEVKREVKRIIGSNEP